MGSSSSAIFGPDPSTYGPYDQPIPQTPMQQAFSEVFAKYGIGPKPQPSQPMQQPEPEPIPTFQRQYVDIQPIQPRELPYLEFNPQPVVGQYTGYGSSTGGGMGNVPAQQSSMNMASGTAGSGGNSLQQAFVNQSSGNSPQDDRTMPGLRGSF